MNRKTRASLVGGTAILMWATLASLTTLTGDIPPFQLTARAFTIASLIGVLLWWRQGGAIKYRLQLPGRIWLLGIFGLFGFHFFYFMALRRAPAVEASLIAYLWPLLIVMGSALLPGQRLRWFHVLGGLLGFLGVGLLIGGGLSFNFQVQYGIGYLFALGSAITWAVYSILSSYFGTVPTDSIGSFCIVTALLALACHLAFEQTVWPSSGLAWLAVIALGLGPVGGAFYTWDYGAKRGRIRVLGPLSYLAPLMSTFLLIALGLAQLTWIVALACTLIVGGAVSAAYDSLHQTTRLKAASRESP